MHTASYLIHTLRSDGILSTLKTILTGFLSVNHFIVFQKNLKQPITPIETLPSIKMFQIDMEDLRQLRDYHSNLPIQFYCDVTHQFTTAFVALVEDRVAAIQWVVHPGERSRFLDIKNGDIELNYNTVLPEFRGHRLARTLMTFVINQCVSNGFNRAFEVVNVKNIPQYKQMIQIGFEPVEVLTHFALFRPKATLSYA